LKQGFNLIGLPVRPDVPLTSRGLLRTLPAAVKVTRFPNTTQTFQDAFRAGSQVLGTDFPLDVGEGYFVQMATAADYEIRGVTLDEGNPLLLRRGFNLIALPSRQLTMSAFDLMRSSPDVVSVIRFNTGTQQFVNTLRAGTRLLGSDFPLRLGEGYFVQVTNDVEVFGSSAKVASLESEAGTPEEFPAFQVSRGQVSARRETVYPDRAGPPGRPHLLFGRVADEHGAPVEQMVVRVIVEGDRGRSLPLHPWTDAEGWWIINLGDARAVGRPGRAFDWQIGDRVLVQVGESQEEGERVTSSGPQFLGPSGRRRTAIPDRPEVRCLYPNPFNSQVVIEYRLPQGDARALPELKIYDLVGQVVKTLAVSAEAGRVQRVVWESTDEAGRPVGSGIYFVTLQTGDERVVRKVVLLR
jgi:hypothetical protein